MNMESERRQWYVHTKKADFQTIAAHFHIDPVTARILRNRDLKDEEEIRLFLEGNRKDLYAPELLPDACKGAALLAEKIREGKRIRIVGDYDIDGVCATYLLYDALKKVGAKVDYRIPERIRDGYGINRRIVEEALQEKVDTLITCDNGISALEELKLASENGLTVICTDHHEIKKDENGREQLPRAEVVLSARRKNSVYPEAEICGAVTAWKLLQLVYRELGQPEERWLSYLEFAGLATIGDVMKLTGENRIIAKEALSSINCKPVNRGLAALITETGLADKKIGAYHIGFVLGPCINAGGRLETAEKAMQLFLSESPEEAEQRAKELKELNDSRKDLTAKGVQQAVKEVEEKLGEDKILVICLPELHESLAGIVAGRIKEQFGKPVFVLTPSELTDETDGSPVLKGSGRSVETWNMFEGLKKAEDLLLRFGGHPMAAGLSLRRDLLEKFRVRINESCGLKTEDLVRKIWIDLPMPLSYVSHRLVRELEELEPFGAGNPKPLFAEKNVRPANLRILGKNRNALKMDLYTSDGCCMSGLMFGDADQIKKELESRRYINILYHPQINEYQGTETLQAVIEDFQ